MITHLSGIEKANYGSKILNLIRTTRTAPNDPAENLQIRSMLLSAIQNSAEGKVRLFSGCNLEVFFEVLVEPRTSLRIASEDLAVPVRLKPGNERHPRPRKAIRECHVVLRGDDAVHADGLRRRFL